MLVLPFCFERLLTSAIMAPGIRQRVNDVTYFHNCVMVSETKVLTFVKANYILFI